MILHKHVSTPVCVSVLLTVCRFCSENIGENCIKWVLRRNFLRMMNEAHFFYLVSHFRLFKFVVPQLSCLSSMYKVFSVT